MNDDQKWTLLKQINNKLGWIIAFLAIIALNTCSLASDFDDFFNIGPDATPRNL